VVHRDLKPANILIRESDGAAKITDFGIARVNSSEMTQAGTTYGSPAYMAPERIQGKPADARSDLFSLAVILYEALSGHRPFKGDDFTSICYAIVNEPPVPIRTHQPELSLAFDAFFRRALAKNPAERFQNGVGFRQGLESVRNQQRMFEAGSETLKMTIPSPQTVLSDLDERIATPVAGALDGQSSVPWRWIAVGAVAMILLLSAFISGWIFSGGEQDGQVGVPLDVNTHPAALELSEAVKGAGQPVPVEEPAPVEVVAPPEPAAVVPEPVVEAVPEPAPPKPLPPVTPEPEAPVETAEAEAPADIPVAPIEEAVTEAAATTEALPEEPVAAIPAGIPVNVRLKNSFKEGSLTFLVDGEEVHSLPLSISSQSGKSPKKGRGKGSQEQQLQIEIPAGHHTVTALAYSTAKDREYEASVEIDLEPGDMRTLLVVAGKTLGKRLTIKLD